MPRALPCADAGLGSVKTSMVFFKGQNIKNLRAVNAFLMKISHMDPFPGVAGRKGKLMELHASGHVGQDPPLDVLNF